MESIINFFSQIIDFIKDGLFGVIDFIKNVFNFLPSTLGQVMPQDFANWISILIPFLIVILIIKMVRGN